MADKARYAKLLIDEPELFQSASDAEITVVTDPAVVLEAESAAARRDLAAGHPPGGEATGVLSEDSFYLVVRDAVRFKNGSLGVYLRVIPRPRNAIGAAILCTRRQNVILVRVFRHATRAWHVEVPRGFAEKGETSEQTARRETTEETGYVPGTLSSLGSIRPNTGILSESVALFHAELSDQKVSGPEHEVVEHAVHDFESMLRDGSIDDGFAIAAFARARLSGYL